MPFDRISQLITHLELGGAERCAVTIGKICAAHAGTHQLLRLTEGLVYDLPEGVSSPVVGRVGPWRDYSTLKTCVGGIMDACTEADTHLIHSHLWIPSFYGALAARRLKCRHLAHVHMEWNWFASRRKRNIARRLAVHLAYRRARTLVVACSAATAEAAKRAVWLPTSRVRVLPNSVTTDPLPRIAKAKGQPLRLTMAGRLHIDKGHVVALEALASARSKGIECELVIAGTGLEEDAIVRAIDRLGLVDVVEMRGFVQHMSELYAETDVLLQPSRREAMPLTVLEAMQAGCIVIASRVGGMEEVIRDRENGLLVDPNSVAQTAAALCRVATMPEEEREAMRSRGASFILEKHSPEAFEMRLSRLYEEILT